MCDAVLILSGGVDSTTLLYDLVDQGYNVYALGFNYGQKHVKELEYAKKTCEKLNVNFKVINLKNLGEIMYSSLTSDKEDIPEGHYESESMKSTVVPNRNMVMLSIATSYACTLKAESLYYGAHGGDHAIYPDCRPEFVEKMRDVIKICDYHPLDLMVPYLDVDKAEIIRKGIILEVDYSLTWTCYSGKERACGKCGSCMERLEAFEYNNIKDPLEYDN